MKSATFAARSWRLLVASAMGAGVLAIAPSSARAYVYESCVDFVLWDSAAWQSIEKNRLDQCTPATSGLYPVYNTNLVRPNVDTLNNYIGRFNTGGPVARYREQMGGHLASAPPIERSWVEEGGGPGMAAGYTPNETLGEAIQRWVQPLRDTHVNTWFNTTWSSPRDNHRPTRYDSDIWTLTFGADLPLLDERLIVGAFGSYTHSDVDTTFNDGGLESRLGAIGPYAVYSLNEYVAFDMAIAGMFGQHDNRVGPPVITAGPMAGMRIGPNSTGQQDVDGFFVSMNANANYWIGNWGVQGRVGFLHSDMETDAYDLSPSGSQARLRIPGTNNELTQFAMAAQLNYFWDRELPYLEEVRAMPFFRITWNHDIDHDNIQLPTMTPQHPNDDDEVVLSWGVSLFGGGPISGSLEAGHTSARERFESWNVSGTISYAF